MGNLTQYMNVKTTKTVLDSYVERDYPRGYPGMSGTGEECLRKQQYEHYFVKKTELEARTLRIFAFGHLFEKIFYDEAKRQGWIVYGDQENLELLDGLLPGHCDGVIEGIPESPKTPHVLELKSLNHKSFTGVKKKGVKADKPMYYAQVQQYMKALKLKRALFVAVNKDNCEYYMERVHYDAQYTKELLNKKLDVLQSEFLLPRMSDNKTFYKCKWCSYYDICHNAYPVDATCRTCMASKFIKGMDWSCYVHKKTLTRDEQIIACDQHTMKGMFSG